MTRRKMCWCEVYKVGLQFSAIEDFKYMKHVRFLININNTSGDNEDLRISSVVLISIKKHVLYLKGSNMKCCSS